MGKAKICFFLILLMLFSTIVAANGKSGASSDSKGTSFTWWALSGGGGVDDPREKVRKDMIAVFEADNPGVTVDLVMLENEAFKQKIQVTIQAGNPPDLFHSWGGGVMAEYAQAGMLRDVTDKVKKDFDGIIGAGAMSVYSYNGKYFGAPYDMGAVGFWYNKDIFKAAGVSAPQTWDELLSAVAKIKAAGYTPIALGAGDKWPAHFWWVYLAMRTGGKEAFDNAYGGSGSFADATFVKAGEHLQELIALEPFQTGFLGSTYDDEGAQMGNGKAAMELMGQWAPGVQVANAVDGAGIGDALGWFAFPSVKGGKGKATDVMGGGGGYVLGKDAPDAAYDMLKFFLTKENNMAISEAEGSIPVVAGAEVVLAGNENAQKMVQTINAADYYQLYYDQLLPPAVGAAVNDAAVALFAGSYSPKECAQSIQDAWAANR
jgi:raffinose/stachyose/melibiose transport system substrate-binding protein